jgi:hypothetical protein
VEPDHLVHFVLDVMDAPDTRLASVNQRGTGRAQYPPATSLARLVYGYATSLFSAATPNFRPMKT